MSNTRHMPSRCVRETFTLTYSNNIADRIYYLLPTLTVRYEAQTKPEIPL